MRKLRVIWPAVMIVVSGACGGSTAPAPPPPPAAWAIGLVTDSLTSSSKLYGSPSWAFYVVQLGPNGAHYGLLPRGILGRDENGRFAHCLAPAGDFGALREVAYVALGDSLYSTDSAAYQRNITRLDQGGAAMLDLFVSLARGDSQAVLPGLITLSSPSFTPHKVSVPIRGATRETAVLRHWDWRDAGNTFGEDTTHAALVACGLS